MRLAEGVFKPTAVQKEALALLRGNAKHILLFGGSRSGKTTVLVVAIIYRACAYPMSRHLICRLRAKDAKSSVWHETLEPWLNRIVGVRRYKPNVHEGYIRLWNGSEIWIGGLGDKEQVDKSGLPYVFHPFHLAEQMETEETTVPCAQLVLEQTDIELNEIGQMYLINVAAEPADTTDELLFASSDESVVTVNEEGRITVQGEGSAVITVTCGEQAMECTVNVVLPEETEEPTEEPTEEATEAPTEPAGERGVVSKLDSDKLNIRKGAGTNNDVVGSYQEGDVVYILERKLAGGTWWGRTELGWISLKYVKFD